jgi:hypothetical protein
MLSGQTEGNPSSRLGFPPGIPLESGADSGIGGEMQWPAPGRRPDESWAFIATPGQLNRKLTRLTLS